MNVAVFSTRAFERSYLEAAARAAGIDSVFFHEQLDEHTAVLASGFPTVSCFVNDRLSEPVLAKLRDGGVRLVAMRCAGYNNVDLPAARRLGITIVRVPEYSPYAVAEHAVALLLMLNRKLYRSYHRVKELNFSLEGLVGFDLHGKTCGVIGVGRIGAVFARIMSGFGCRVLGHDTAGSSGVESLEGFEYTSLERLYAESDVISLHVPLTPDTAHLIDAAALARMKRGVLLINTSRGALIHTKDLIDALKQGRIGGAALDVYEEEEGVFFEDRSLDVLQDDVLARLLTFPNVVVTAHQAFLTEEALRAIAHTTFDNIRDFGAERRLVNEVVAPGAR